LIGKGPPRKETGGNDYRVAAGKMGDEKPKLTFVVTSQLSVRNYFQTDALSTLDEAFDVTFVVADSLSNPEPIKKPGRRIIWYSSDQENIKAQFKTYKVLMWRFRQRSSTFQFRLDRMFEPKRPFPHFGFATVGQTVSATLERIGIAYRKARLALLASDPIFAMVRRRRIDLMEPAAGIAAALEKAGGDLIVAPSSAFDPECNDVIRQAERMGVRTLFLIDNWDNLSSKSVMLMRPDHIGVWGEQSAKHAREIQDFTPEQISLLGTPRFDRYFTDREAEVPSPFDFPYLLFLGTSLAFDEISALEHLEEVLTRNQDRFEGVKLVYRPHPWREGKDSIEGRSFRHIVLDPQLAARRDAGLAFQPDLAYYPQLLANAEVVMGGLTSMLIEATIFGKDYIALTYDDGKHITNQQTVLRRSEHFRGVERIPSLCLCQTIADLEPYLQKAWDARGTRRLIDIDDGRRYILFDDGRRYPDRLASLVQAQLNAGQRCV